MSSDAVQVMRVKNPDQRHQMLLWELGFRVSSRPDVWAMVFDMRLPRAAAQMLSVQQRVAALGIEVTQRAARMGQPPVLKNSPQSAKSWLAKNDLDSERLAKIRKKRRSARNKKQARNNTAMIAGRMRPVKP